MEKDAFYIKELISGSHDAFRQLFMSYFPRVKYFIAHLTKSENIAESKKTVENHLNLALKEIRKNLLLFTAFFF